MRRYAGLPVLLLSSVAIVPALALCAGCPQYRDPTVPGEVRRVKEPGLGGEYFVYAPVDYDPAKQWALIVVCHGTLGFDSAKRQIGDWVKLAEERQIIVAAPKLQGVNGVFPPLARRQIELQRRDEQTILACVQHVRAAYNIATDRVFLTGWSAGNFAVLFTGLRNPQTFRALAVLQGNFNGDYLSDVGKAIDPFQPVYVLYGSSDVITGRHGQRCMEWLQEHRAAVTEEEVAGAHKNHPKQAYGFFERVVRKVPWLHIRPLTADPADRMTVRFDIRASFEPRRYEWSFGDGQTSPVASPIHTYTSPGDYTVTLDAETAQGKTVRRALEIAVPRGRPL